MIGAPSRGAKRGRFSLAYGESLGHLRRFNYLCLPFPPPPRLTPSQRQEKCNSTISTRHCSARAAMSKATHRLSVQDLEKHAPRQRPDFISVMSRLGYHLLPSFLQKSPKARPKHGGIAALDGLRGLACLFVFNEHYVICYQSKNSQHWINRVPFIRLWWYGKGAVFLFFVISGYVLSYKPLKQIRSRQYEELQNTMASATIRRAFRLYLPCLAMSAVACVLTSLGGFDSATEIYKEYADYLFLKEPPPPHEPTLARQWALWWTNYRFIICATFPFNIELSEWWYFKYDDHQWSIPVEYRCSIALFMVLIGTSRMKTIWRMLTVFIINSYLYNSDRGHAALFFGGMFIAELDLLRQSYTSSTNHINSKTPPSYLKPLLQLSERTYEWFWFIVFVLGYFMISSPIENQWEKGNWLPHALESWVAHPDEFILSYGSILTVWGVANSKALGKVFLHPAVLYLGYISYALYLVHGTVIKSLGYLWMPYTLRIATFTPPSVALSKEWWDGVTNTQATVAHILGYVVVGSVVFWGSDLFWRYVDVPVVSFARWVERKLSVADSS
ncbi:acyltransferase family-domain-containing protein [Exophiala viscosa]|uniref:acyltransferase family-domain-containing protein n=1 Tax=Exophiala viscosa TaxID=2486360 RepID=UPI00219A0947|nr:acyltransferase family-domain-containing protein [Exophiala viscosa]